jgi:hypothetical protein
VDLPYPFFVTPVLSLAFHYHIVTGSPAVASEPLTSPTELYISTATSVQSLSQPNTSRTSTTTITIMPALVHLVPRVFGDGSATTGGISATAIGLIVGLGIIPLIILIWVVSWLFWCYPYDRSCCCTRRKKKQPDVEKPGPFHKTGRSLDSFHEKSAYPMPARPSAANVRTESGNSNRLTKTDPRLSINSSNTIQEMQEPKRFV